MNNEKIDEKEEKKTDTKPMNSQISAMILIGLIGLITGASVLLHNNFNIIGQYDDGGGVEGVFTEGDYAYVAARNGGLEIIDISDPTTPVKVGQFNDGVGYTNDIYVSGSYAYLADSWDGCGLKIIDISDPTTPVKVGQFNDGEGYTHFRPDCPCESGTIH